MLILNSLALLALSAGHAELIVAAINRLHSRPLAPACLKSSRRVHDVAILLFPLILFGAIGLGGPAVLRGGSWSGLTTGWRIYLAGCALGVVSLVVAAVRWQLARPSPAVRKQESQFADIAAELGRRPIGPGRYQVMARWPGNESYTIEFSRKELEIPSLAEEFDGLRILHLSDLHYFGTIDRAYFDAVFAKLADHDADLIALTGDLFDNLELLPWLESTLFRLNAPLGRFFVLGNHDSYLEAEAIRGAMAASGWVDVAGDLRYISHAGVSIAVSGTEWPWLGRRPESVGEPPAFRLVLSHSPDEFRWAQHLGAQLVLAGHNHGGQIALPVLGPVYSPSRYGIRYASGVFQEGSAVMHVSRGLSGRYPLRWNCRPEIATIVLRRASGS